MTQPAPSTLLRDELFESESPEFVEYLRTFTSDKGLSVFVDRWKIDKRPWARDQVRAYAAQPMDRPGHEVVVKRLFKQAEEDGDLEALGWWAAAFDRLLRRRRKGWTYWDRVSGQYVSIHRLDGGWNRVTPNPADRRTDRRNRPHDRLFTQATRYYLCRRVWRTFRHLGYSDPAAYVPAVTSALANYTDGDLALGENLLDSWFLMHACFHGSDALEFTVRQTALKEGRSIGDLAPAPYHTALWRTVEAFEPLVDLVLGAQGAAVRVFALDLIEAHHAQLIPTISKDRLFQLVEHADPRAAEFGGRAFGESDCLAALPIDEWVALLNRPGSTVLSEVTAAFRKHVDPARLSTGEILQLCVVRPEPVVRLGLDLLVARHGQVPLQPAELEGLAAMTCAAHGTEAATWAFEQRYAAGDPLDLEFETVFFDAMLAPLRSVAIGRLTAGSAGWNEPELWTRLIESPYPDVRFGLIDRLRERGAAPGDAQGLGAVWSTVILGVHSGSRWKPKALDQIVDAVHGDPGAAQVPGLISVLAIAVRSIRLAERRTGLSAIARLLEIAPSLEPLVQECLPELGLAPRDAISGEAG